jgi:hypothetical protein
MRAAKKLLGASTIGGGSARAGGGGGGIFKGVKYSLLSPKIFENGKKQAVSLTFWPINRQKCNFSLINTSQDILLRCF